MFDYEIFSLPEKEVRIIEKEQTKRNEFLITIKGKVIRHQCPKCGGINTKRVGKQYEEVIVSHMFLSNYTILKLRILKRRFKCLDCEKKGIPNTFIERFSFLKSGCEYTETFKDYIIQERGQSSLAELGRKFKVSDYLIFNVIGRIDIKEEEIKKIEYLKSLKEIYLGIDELSFRGRNYILQITEIKTRKVVGILKSNTKKELERWLKLLPKEVLRKIKGITTDMTNNYKYTIQKYLEQEIEIIENISVADHYHIVQMFMKLILEVYSMNNWMIKAGHYGGGIKDLCTEDTKNYNKYREDKLEGIKEYKTNFKGYTPITLGFYLSKRYVKLMQMKKENLSKKQRHRLNQIFKEFDPCGYMKQAYEGKEMLLKGLKEKDETMVERIINKYKKSIHYKIETVSRTLKKWQKEIQNLLRIGITNAVVEGKNTKAKLFKRMAYGYKIKDNYMKRLLLCL